MLAHLFLLSFPVLPVILGLSCPKDQSLRHSLRMLLTLPALAVLLFLWPAIIAGFLGRGLGKGGLPEWVNYPEYAAFVAIALLSIYYIWRLKGARLFAVTAAIMNAYLTLGMGILGGMEITGDPV